MTTFEKMLAESAAEVKAAAQTSQAELRKAIGDLQKAGYRQVRADQFEKDGVLVEVGYAYGESRLTLSRNGLPLEDIRLSGRDRARYKRFELLTGV